MTRKRIAVDYQLEDYRLRIKMKAAEKNITISDLYKVAITVAFPDLEEITKQEWEASK